MAERSTSTVQGTPGPVVKPVMTVATEESKEDSAMESPAKERQLEVNPFPAELAALKEGEEAERLKSDLLSAITEGDDRRIVSKSDGTDNQSEPINSTEQVANALETKKVPTEVSDISHHEEKSNEITEQRNGPAEPSVAKNLLDVENVESTTKPNAAEPVDTETTIPLPTVLTSMDPSIHSIASALPGAIAGEESHAETVEESPSTRDGPSLQVETTEVPAVQSKPKTKRKRNAMAGPSRLSEPVTSSSPSDRTIPPHYLGEDNSLIRCICGIDEDDGFTIQCEGCFAWEHALCFGYAENDYASLPAVYFCELCDPRPVDAELARKRQLQGRLAYDVNGQKVGVSEDGGEAKGKAARSKVKRARTGSTMEDDSDVKEASPARMAPPVIKPKRKPGPIPRSGIKPKSSDSTTNPTPPVPTFKEPLPPPIEANEDYFKIDPWELEFTPINDNIVRGVKARNTLGKFYKEWVEEDWNESEREREKRRRSTVDDQSGLPSPTEPGTRLSPDDIFPPPDFSILAPPIPPVYLTGTDLSSLAISTIIRPIKDNSSFLPLNYLESSPATGVYSRPSIYGVFPDEPVPMGSFIGEYRGEIIDAESYRNEPINQYAGLGMPKPFVRSLGPPVDLVIDSRGYGCKLRFIRSGCHPNVVIRPLIFRPPSYSSSSPFSASASANDPPQPRIKFGIFASRDISKKEEIVLGWEWDDQHLIHHLRTLIDRDLNTVPVELLKLLAEKGDLVLTHIFGTFSSCACRLPSNCAITQLCRLVEGKPFYLPGQRFQQSSSSLNGVTGAGKRSKKADLGVLVGAVRGWRRREMERRDAKRLDHVLSRRNQRDTPVSSSGPDGPQEDDESARMDEDEGEGEGEGDGEGEGEGEGEGGGDGDDSMDIDKPNIQSPVSSLSPEIRISTLAKIDAQSLMEGEGEDIKPSPMNLLNPPTIGRNNSSSSLSSAASSIPDEDQDDGELSDATTATIAKSTFSDSEQSSDSDAEEEEEGDSNAIDEVDGENAQASRSEEETPRQQSFRRARRVLSPVQERERVKSDILHRSDHSEEDEPVKTKLPDKKQNKSGAVPRGLIDKANNALVRPGLATQESLKVKTSKANIMFPRRGRKARVVSSASEDERMDIDTPAVSRLSSSSAAPDSESSSGNGNGSAPVEARAVVPDQIVAPMAPPSEVNPSAAELLSDKSTIPNSPPREPTPPPPREVTPPREPTPPPPKKVSLSEWLKAKKASKIAAAQLSGGVGEGGTEPFSDPSSTSVLGAKLELDTPTYIPSDSPKSTKPLNLFEHLPTSRSTQTSNLVNGNVMGVPSTPGSTATAGYHPSFSTPGFDSPKAMTTTPSSSYTPRATTAALSTSTSSYSHEGYFPPQSPSQPMTTSTTAMMTASYVPRTSLSGSYVPRQSSLDTPSISGGQGVGSLGDAAGGPGGAGDTSQSLGLGRTGSSTTLSAPPAYAPRNMSGSGPTSTTTPAGAGSAIPGLNLLGSAGSTPTSTSTTTPPRMPPVLGMRDLPPHHPSFSGTGTGTANLSGHVSLPPPPPPPPSQALSSTAIANPSSHPLPQTPTGQTSFNASVTSSTTFPSKTPQNHNLPSNPYPHSSPPIVTGQSTNTDTSANTGTGTGTGAGTGTGTGQTLSRPPPTGPKVPPPGPRSAAGGGGLRLMQSARLAPSYTRGRGGFLNERGFFGSGRGLGRGGYRGRGRGT